MTDRSGWPRFLSVALLLGLPMAAGAQPAPVVSGAPPETVTVTGNRIVPAITVDHFIRATAAPTPFLGKLARWSDRLCPKVSGLKPGVNDFIQQRVLTVATMMRVKADTRTPCRVNLEIVFTPAPQAFMNDIKKNFPDMLGFHDDSPTQAERLATMTRPIQAWYETQVRDDTGEVQPEQRFAACVQKRGGVMSPSNFGELMRNARLCGTAGKSSLIANGISSDFANVLIVADTGKLSGIAIAPLADYIAMLALSQTQPSGTCQELPTIANLLAPVCPAANVPGALTDVDIAYLKALYAMDPDEKLAFQQGDIASRMKQTLNGH